MKAASRFNTEGNMVKQETTQNNERGSKRFMKPRSFEAKPASEFEEQVIEVRRVSRTVKGGRRISFRALVIVGNRKGKVGMGMAKATDVSEAVKKAVTQAKKKFVEVPIINGTIPYEVTSKHGSAVVMLRPASAGTSIVAGGSIRVVANLVGITDLLSKMMGSASKVNNVIATLKAFASFDPEYVAKIRKFSEKSDHEITVSATPETEIETKEKIETSPTTQSPKLSESKTTVKTAKKESK